MSALAQIPISFSAQPVTRGLHSCNLHDSLSASFPSFIAASAGGRLQNAADESVKMNSKVPSTTVWLKGSHNLKSEQKKRWPKSHQVGRGSARSLPTWSAEWLDNRALVEVDVSLQEAWKLWEDRELIPNWMPWIASVKVQKDKPELSRWTLSWDAFGQKFEFSWIAKNLQPIHHQKIHWRSVDGLANRGAVRFYPRGSSACGVELTISYEVPAVLSPFASGLAPLVESIIQQDLNRFAKYAKMRSLQPKA